MNVHNLKIKPNYFKDVIAEVKKFEIRFNDRGFEVGDLIVLEERNIIKHIRLTKLYEGGSNMSMTDEFIKDNSNVIEISKDVFETDKKEGVKTRICDFQKGEFVGELHPLKTILVLADEENIGANESDPVGSYCVCFDFMHKGKCYRYYDQG